MSIHIITDSAVDVAEESKSRLYSAVPLTVSFGEEDFADGVTLSKDEFYNRLERSKELPRTSQPSPDAFEEVFSRLQEQGESAVVITISSGVSGTYQSACLAAEDFPNVRVVEFFPDVVHEFRRFFRFPVADDNQTVFVVRSGVCHQGVSPCFDAGE